jgi:predicted RNase H-like nuclease
VPTNTLIGFDSAWTDKLDAPGAICAMVFDGTQPVEFHAPRLATFAEALRFIREVRSPDGATLLALDQPTIVPNNTSMRPVERVAASLISWMGGGVQPANRSKVGMFCDASPVWGFLRELGAIETPEASRGAAHGLHLIEVFPALALASFGPQFFGRLAAPKYNPARRKTFRLADWQRVAGVAADRFRAFGADDPAAWCASQEDIVTPKKEDQDRLDAMLCLLVAMQWRLAPRDQSMMLGSLDSGYMVFPASADVRERIETAAARCGVTAD